MGTKNADYCRTWYQKNRAKRRAQLAEQQRENRRRYAEYKATLSCERCGFSHPAALHFHHKDPNQKAFGVADGVKSMSWERLLSEIQKCEVLCANCHAIQHYTAPSVV
jgi:hypothetical protein